MKRKICLSIFVVHVLVLFQTICYGQNEKFLKFADGQELTAANNIFESIRSISIMEKEFKATLTSFGKANPLNSDLLDKLREENRDIYNQTKNINTAFDLIQGGNKFYIRGFDSIDLSEFRDGQAKVMCRIFLIKVISKEEKVYYLPLIASIRRL